MGSQGGENLSTAAPLLRDRPPPEPWRRVVARVIDVATVATLLWTLVVSHVFWFMGAWSDRVQPQPWGRGFVAGVTLAVMAAGYEVLFLVANAGQTPGKDIMNLRVVPTTGSVRVGAGSAVRRGVLVGVVVLIRPFWLVAVAIAVAAATLWLRRPPTDAISGTVVVAYDRDLEDPAARRPSSRRHRLARARAEADATESGPPETRRPNGAVDDASGR